MSNCTSQIIEMASLITHNSIMDLWYKDIKDATHITSIIQSHLIMQRKIQILIQACSTKPLISNHTERTPEYGKHITHWLKGSICSDTTKCDTFYPNIHIYIISYMKMQN